MEMTGKKIQIPPRLGGGDVVMREISTGEHEDRLKKTAGLADAAWVDHLSDQVCAAIVTFRGKPLPVGSEREAWWRSNGSALRAFLIGCHKHINATSDKEIEDFFAAAEAVAVPPTIR